MSFGKCVPHACAAQVQVPGGSRIVSMTLNRKGTRLLVNCYDRAVRLYETCHPGKRRKSYSAADLKTRLAAVKVVGSMVSCTDPHSWPLIQRLLGIQYSGGRHSPCTPLAHQTTVYNWFRWSIFMSSRASLLLSLLQVSTSRQLCRQAWLKEHSYVLRCLRSTATHLHSGFFLHAFAQQKQYPCAFLLE